MDKGKIIQRLMETFLAEFEERLQGMSRDLLALEAASENEGERQRLIQGLLRDAHSLKGAARAVDLKLIEESCHSFEDIMEALQKTPKLLSKSLFQLLFSALDGLEEVLRRLRGRQSLEGANLEGVALDMELFIGQTLLAPNAAAPPPSRPPAEIERSAPQKSTEPQHPPAAESLTVRVDTEKLDLLLSRSGELLVARQRLRSTVEKLEALREDVGKLHADWKRTIAFRERMERGQETAGPQTELPARMKELIERTPQRLEKLEAEIEASRLAFVNDWRLLDQAVVALDAQVRRVRMLPFSHCLSGFERMVRDLSQSAGKEAELVIEGGDVEIDRSILEGLKDPLRHLIRNAIDHGIEKPEERVQKGKPRHGSIRASATLRGGQVQVQVHDDGRGLVVDSIRQRAEKMNLPVPKNDSDLAQVLFTPGFSTAGDAVTLVSGRGIGLDVVKTQIKALHGEVEVLFTPGRGVQFQLTVPLTLTMLRVLLVTAQKQTFAISSAHVQKLLRIQYQDLLWVGDRPVVLVEGRPVSLVSLAEVLMLKRTDRNRWAGKLPVVVISTEERQVAFLVDALLAEQEVMVKSLGARVQRIRHIAGALILPNGRIALTLHVADLVKTAATHLATPELAAAAALPPAAAEVEEGGKKRQRKILVVDDSMTTRNLERSILEGAGFSVVVGIDGMNGWELVQTGGFDLVLSDVDMPRMTGLQLTESIRKSERFRTLPVILITSHDELEHKEKAMTAGASGYIVKGEFDQNAKSAYNN